MSEINFEQAMKRLTEITKLLEGEELPLDDAIKLFEEGLDLSSKCQKRLDLYEERVNELMESHSNEANDA